MYEHAQKLLTKMKSGATDEKSERYIRAKETVEVRFNVNRLFIGVK